MEAPLHRETHGSGFVLLLVRGVAQSGCLQLLFSAVCSIYQSVPLCDTAKTLLPCLRKGPSFWWLERKPWLARRGMGMEHPKPTGILVCTCSPFLCLFLVALLYNILLLLRRPTCFTDGVVSAEVSLESQSRDLAQSESVFQGRIRPSAVLA